MKKVLFFVFISTICQQVFAEKETISNRTITQIRGYATKAVIYFSPSATNSQNCGASTNRVIVKYGEEGKEIFSLALTAAAAKKLINLAIEGCDGANPLAYRIDVDF